MTNVTAMMSYNSAPETTNACGAEHACSKTAFLHSGFSWGKTAISAISLFIGKIIAVVRLSRIIDKYIEIRICTQNRFRLCDL